MAKVIQRLESMLQAGENFIWIGAPDLDKDYGKADRVLLPVSGLMLAVCTFFAMFVLFSAARGGFSGAHVFGLILLLIVGGITVYTFFFRFAVKRRNKAALVYGITDRHRVMIYNKTTKKVTLFSARETVDAELTEVDQYGIGTIYLEPRRFTTLLDNTGLDIFGKNNVSQIALLDVHNCEDMCKYLRAEN